MRLGQRCQSEVAHNHSEICSCVPFTQDSLEAGDASLIQARRRSADALCLRHRHVDTQALALRSRSQCFHFHLPAAARSKGHLAFAILSVEFIVAAWNWLLVQHCRLVMIVHVVHATGNLGPTECADTVACPRYTNGCCGRAGLLTFL